MLTAYLILAVAVLLWTAYVAAMVRGELAGSRACRALLLGQFWLADPLTPAFVWGAAYLIGRRRSA
jgi:uncharacterized protein (DUF2062 family)